MPTGSVPILVLQDRPSAESYCYTMCCGFSQRGQTTDFCMKWKSRCVKVLDLAFIRKTCVIKRRGLWVRSSYSENQVGGWHVGMIARARWYARLSNVHLPYWWISVQWFAFPISDAFSVTILGVKWCLFNPITNINNYPRYAVGFYNGVTGKPYVLAGSPVQITHYNYWRYIAFNPEFAPAFNNGDLKIWWGWQNRIMVQQPPKGAMWGLGQW